MKKLSTIVSIVTLSIFLCWQFALATPSLPIPFWKLKFENYEWLAPPIMPGTNLADGVEDNWGIFKVTSLINRGTNTTVWSDLATEQYEITGMFYNIDIDEVYMHSPTIFETNVSNRMITPQLDLYIQDKWAAGYSAFDPTQGPFGPDNIQGTADDPRTGVNVYNTATDGTSLLSCLFEPGILMESSPDASDTVIRNILSSLTVPITGDGSGYMDVIDGSGLWADQVMRDVFQLWYGPGPLAGIDRDIFFEFNMRDHPDVGIPDWNWTVNSEDPAFGNAIPEPATMLLLGSGLAGLAAFARRRRK